jgi:hypothetical protein
MSDKLIDRLIARLRRLPPEKLGLVAHFLTALEYGEPSPPCTASGPDARGVLQLPEQREWPHAPLDRLSD